MTTIADVDQGEAQLRDPGEEPATAEGFAPAGTLRAVTVGAVVGIVAAFAFVGGGMLLSGFTGSAALAVGGMAALWGGLGFGSMFGGVMHLTRLDDD